MGLRSRARLVHIQFMLLPLRLLFRIRIMFSTVEVGIGYMSQQILSFSAVNYLLYMSLFRFVLRGDTVFGFGRCYDD